MSLPETGRRNDWLVLARRRAARRAPGRGAFRRNRVSLGRARLLAHDGRGRRCVTNPCPPAPLRFPPQSASECFGRPLITRSRSGTSVPRAACGRPPAVCSPSDLRADLHIPLRSGATKDLDRKYQAMERDRKSYTDESQNVIRKQRYVVRRPARPPARFRSSPEFCTRPGRCRAAAFVGCCSWRTLAHARIVPFAGPRWIS